MDCNNPEILKDPGGDPGLTGGCEHSEAFCPEKETGRCSSCMVPEDLTTNASWSQRSISRSLQRAETLLKSTFNPSLKWLFHGRSQDEDVDEGNFVVAPNLVSRSSARLLRLQHALLTVAPQWQQVDAPPQVCVKGLPAEGGVVYLPSSSFLQGHYRALWKLLEQRSLLLFTHEYIRRVRLTTAFISRVSHLLEEQLKKSHLKQGLSSWSSAWVSLGSLSQELRVHLNHWSCLFSKVKSDDYLRPALVQQTQLLVEVRHTLDSLSLQALVLMEHYVYVILSAAALTDLNSVPREVLEDIVAGTELYNQAVEEQRAQRYATQLRTVVLQQAHYNIISSLPACKRHHPAAFSVKELTMILAVHHAEMAAKQLDCWMPKQSYQMCPIHNSSSLLAVNHRSSLRSSSHTTCCKTPLYIPDLHLDSTVQENHHPVLPKPVPIQHREYDSCKKQINQCQTYISQSGPAQASEDALDLVKPNLERETGLGNSELLHAGSPPSTSSHHHHSALPLLEFWQQDHSLVELFFQVLISSSDLLAPLVSYTPTPEAPPEHLLPNTMTDVFSTDGKTEPVISTGPIIAKGDSLELNKDQNVDETQQEWAELEITTTPEAVDSSGFHTNGDPEKGDTVGAGGTTVESDCARCPPSVQWLDLSQSLVYDSVLGQYRALLQTLSCKALWLQLIVPQSGNSAGSINLQDNHGVFQLLHQLSQASQTDLVPKECRTLLEDLSLYLLVITSHAQWDYELCRSLGSSLKDKCLTDVNQGRHSVMSSPNQDGSVVMSATMQHFQLLSSPLLSSLRCYHSHSSASGSFSLPRSRISLQRQTLSLVLATVQLSTVWVMSKAYQFLSSWSLNKFLLITQGDLKVLREWLEVMVHQTKSLMMNSDRNHHSALHNHNQLQLRQQLEALDRAVCELQTFSSLVLKTFSSDCKRVSGEIFEQTMPSAVHWRLSHRTGFPISPSEYASLAAQTVIGQVLESVAPLSDDARVQALSITMTAFFEAWMEHILKQKIKFSVQGALQLKQDFDSIREMIQSDKYGLSAELHQRLLSLRVFQQVDSAVVCLLQQPQAKPYLQSRAWEPFTRCCLSTSSRGSVNAAVGSSITNLRCMDGEDLSQTDPSDMTHNLPPVDPSIPGEPYLAPRSGCCSAGVVEPADPQQCPSLEAAGSAVSLEV
ncbi:uncharacterized protein ccdc142 isoform X2 [Anabas testudineus]|uniref:uncharacterized protein ccdc142 isoform X2 n=1 Tax=Anabas testudineus TaxID=64144 RepID=UPI000E462A55|nr:uncharacterized protein ccdc142 isoform X2 [Anabas testudineus]